MAATTTVTTLFGAPGVSDQEMFHPGLVGIRRRIDFSKSATLASTNYELFGIPKGFVVFGTFIASDKDKNGNYPAATEAVLKWKHATATASDIEIGDGFTPSASAYKRQTKMQSLFSQDDSTKAVSASETAFDEGGIVYITPGAQSTGVIDITIFGFVPDGDSLENVATSAPRAAVQATATQQDNVASADPYNAK